MSTETETQPIEQKEFSAMPLEDQKALVAKIGAILKENDLEDAEVVWSTYKVANMMDMKMEEQCSLSVSKDLPASEAEKAEKFNAAMKPLLEGIKGCRINVAAKLGPGDPYKTI